MRLNNPLLKQAGTIRALYSLSSPTASHASYGASQELCNRGQIAFPADVLAMRIRVRNWYPSTTVGGVAVAGAINITGLWMGVPLQPAAPPWLGYCKNPLTQVVPTFNTDAGGAESYSNWVTNRAVLPRRDQVYAWSMGAVMPSGVTFATGSLGGLLFGLGSGNGKNLSTAAQAGGAHIPGGVAPAAVATGGGNLLDLRLEVVMRDMPVVSAFGDSIFAGYGHDYPNYAHEGAFGRAGLAHGFAAQNLSIGGQQGALYAADPLTSQRYQRVDWDTSPPDAVIIAHGRNDIDPGGAASSEATLQANIQTLMDNARALAPRAKIYLTSVMPGQFTGGTSGNLAAGTYNAIRLAYNAWARSLPYGAHGCIDWDDAMNPPGTPLNGDSTVNGNPLYMVETDPHPYRAGQSVLAKTFPSFAR